MRSEAGNLSLPVCDVVRPPAAVTAGATFCWQCGRPLTFVRGELVFETVTTPSGVNLRTHKVCKDSAQRSFFHATVPVPVHMPKCGVCSGMHPPGMCDGR